MTLIVLALALLVPQAAYKPTECMNNQCTSDPADAKEGRWMTYLMEASGSKVTNTVKVVGKVDDDWLIEQWMDLGTLSYGYLFRLGPDKKIKKAWAAAKGDGAWTAIPVKEPPKPLPGAGPKPDIQQSEERKEIKPGKVECVRLDVTVNVQGKDYSSITWYSKRIWKLYLSSEHGGMVGMEATGSKVTLDGMGEDAKPTLPLPQ